MGTINHVEMVMGTVVDTMVVVAVVAIRGAIVTKVNGRVEVHMGVHVVECAGTNCPNSTTTRTKAQLQWFLGQPKMWFVINVANQAILSGFVHKIKVAKTITTIAKSGIQVLVASN